EDRLAGVPARIAAPEMPRAILPDLRREMTASELEVETHSLVERSRIDSLGRLEEGLHRRELVARAMLREIRKRVIVVVDADERRVDRTAAVVAREEPVQPARGLEHRCRGEPCHCGQPGAAGPPSSTQPST